MVKHKNQPKIPKLLSVKTLIYLSVLLLLLIAVVPNINDLRAGIQALGGADTQWLAIAVISILATYFAAAYTYVILARIKLKYFRSVAVQIAASFVNRLLPSGVGGLGLNIDYLLKSGHTVATATSVTAVNSAAAFISYVLLLCSALVFSSTSPTNLLAGKAISPWILIVIISLGFVVAMTLFYWQSMRRKIIKLGQDTWRDILKYRHQPQKIILAIIGASLMTVFYVLALYASAHAVDVQITVVQAFIAYTVGTLVGAVLPTPGGLGGVEAGLYASLVGFGYDTSLVLSTIIIYRLMTFWLPIIPGYISFWLLQRKKYI